MKRSILVSLLFLMCCVDKTAHKTMRSKYVSFEYPVEFKLESSIDSRKEMYWLKNADGLVVIISAIKAGECYDGFIDFAYGTIAKEYTDRGAPIKQETRKTTARRIGGKLIQGYSNEFMVLSYHFVFEVYALTLNGCCVQYLLQYPSEQTSTINSQVAAIDRTLH